MRATHGQVVVAKEPDPFRTLLTPSRDVWQAVLLGEIEDVLGQPGATDRQKAVELLGIVTRERDRHMAEER